MDRETAVADNPQPSPTDDRSLLALVQSGDEQSMATLYDRYSTVVYSVALRVLADQAATEDVLQAVFMQIWRNPESFNADGGGLGGGLALHARTRALDALRRRHSTGPTGPVALDLPANLAGEAGRNALAKRARAGLHQLSSAQRKILEAAFFDGLTHGEIAETTGDPVSAVRTTLRGALLVLHEVLHETLREAVQP